MRTIDPERLLERRHRHTPPPVDVPARKKQLLNSVAQAYVDAHKETAS